MFDETVFPIDNLTKLKKKAIKVKVDQLISSMSDHEYFLTTYQESKAAAKKRGKEKKIQLKMERNQRKKSYEKQQEELKELKKQLSECDAD
jgi:hypothetical protein